MDIDNRIKKLLIYFKNKNIKPKEIYFIKQFLRDVGYNSSESKIIHNIYSYNHDRDIDKDDLLNPKEELLKFIKKLEGESEGGRNNYIDLLFDDGEIIKYLGEKFLKSDVEFEFDYSGLTLHLEQNDWEEHFSGLSPDDLWVYNLINAYYIESEDYDFDEFNYVLNNKETSDILEKIAELYNLDDYPGKNGNIDSYEIANFLQKYLPTKIYDDLVNEYLNTLGYEVSKSRKKSAERFYEDEVKYEHYSCNGYY